MTESKPKVRARIAPTPSGYLHFGNILSFVITALLTRSFDGLLRLRIDDLDRSRFRAAYLEDIFALIELLELPVEEGPSGVADFHNNHSQLLRVSSYHSVLNRLKAEGHCYVCQCSRASFSRVNAGTTCACVDLNLHPSTAQTVWRMRALPKTLTVHDLDGVTHENYLRLNPGFIPLRQRDGSPSYQIASISDDLHDQVNLIVRGADLIPSTALQLHLSELLSFEAFKSSRFFHHDLVLQQGQKLSKSAGASRKSLREEGLTKRICYQKISELLGFHDKPSDDFNALYERARVELIERLRSSFNHPIRTQ